MHVASSPLKGESQKKVLIVYDVDFSLINTNSDTWVFEVLSPPLHEKLLSRQESVQFTDLIDQLLGELYDSGVTRKQIENTLREIPLHVTMLEAIRVAERAQADLMILSDANRVYIENILEASKIRSAFGKIVTNHAEWDDQGRLRVRRFHGSDLEPHLCPNGCAVNLCKGREILSHLNNNTQYEKILYVGDSTNDYCPATKLGKNDILLCRKGRSLEKRLRTNPIGAEVVYWEGDSPDEVLKTFEKVLGWTTGDRS